MNLAGTKRFKKILLAIKLLFLTKLFAVHSVTSFDVNSFICDGKELIDTYLSTNEIISSKHII